MAVCELTGCFGPPPSECVDPAAGGATELYVILTKDIDSFTLGADGTYTDSIVAGLTMKAGKYARRIYFDETAGAQVTSDFVDATNRTLFTQTVTFNTGSLRNADMEALRVMAQTSKGLAFIAKLDTGEYKYLGDTDLNRGLRLVGGAATSGRAQTDPLGVIDANFQMTNYKRPFREFDITGGTQAWINTNAIQCDGTDEIEIAAVGGTTVTLAASGTSAAKTVNITWGSACTDGVLAVNEDISTLPSGVVVNFLTPGTAPDVDSGDATFSFEIEDTGAATPGSYIMALAILTSGTCGDSNTISFTVTIS